MSDLPRKVTKAQPSEQLKFRSWYDAGFTLRSKDDKAKRLEDVEGSFERYPTIPYVRSSVNSYLYKVSLCLMSML